MSKHFPKSSKVIKRGKYFQAWIINDFAKDYVGLVAPKYKLGEYLTREAAETAIKNELESATAQKGSEL